MTEKIFKTAKQFTLTKVAAMLTHGRATVFKHFSWTMMLQTEKEIKHFFTNTNN
jgi:hypothetical protein